MERLWVARLYISQRTAQKIVHRHRISEYEVRDAVVCVAGLPFAWDHDPERGRRAIVEARIRSRRVLVVLYPTDDPAAMRITWAASTSFDQ